MILQKFRGSICSFNLVYRVVKRIKAPQTIKIRTMSSQVQYVYPSARRENVVEEIFGKKIHDPYRYLEAPDSEETKKFIEEQNNLSVPILRDGDIFSTIHGKLSKLWNFEKFSGASKRGNRYFYSHNSGLQNQNVIYYQNSLNEKEERKVFINPNDFSSDGTISLQFLVFSHDGKRAAYGISESGSDWVKIKFRNVETNEDYPETLLHSKFFRPAFTHDNQGVYYGRFLPEKGKADGSETDANENQKVFYHTIGKDQSSDVLVAEFPEHKNWRFSAVVSDCGNYLVFYVMVGCNDQLLYFADLRKPLNADGRLNFSKIVEKFEADYDYITNDGSIFYFRTNKEAKNFRIVAIDFNNFAESEWKTVIEESKDVLDWACCVDNDKIVLHYLKDVNSVLAVHSLKDGKFQFKFDLDLGSVTEFYGDKESSEIFYHFVSYLNPGVIYHYDFKNGEKPTIFKEIRLENFNRNDFVCEQVFYESFDKVKIPMFIIRKKEDKVKAKPCLLYGYGGFAISLRASFSITFLAFVEHFDGVLAYANIRGGGEYGTEWHDSGRLLNKQNVFNDFQEGAKYLIANNYTTKKQLAIQGGSNGGLLVAACINQASNLYQACIAQVGVFDMLRFHKFTIGSAWVSDFGSPDEEKHFKNLLAYSPLHNTKKPSNPDEEYPATLILTGDHDDRVSPLHSLKFAATLQHDVKDSVYQKNPILLRVYTKTGHGQGKSVTQKIDEAAELLAFLYKFLKHN